jgi:hypothetical protein
LALFPLAWKPDARRRSLTGTPASSGKPAGHGAGRALSHADTLDSLTLMAKEIMPRLKEYKQPEAVQNAAA